MKLQKAQNKTTESTVPLSHIKPGECAELGAKAYNTVQLEGWLIQAINRHGFQEGLSVHQVLGAMEVVKQEVLDKWKESKAAKPQNTK